MSHSSRIALIVSTLAILVAGFVLLKPTDDDSPVAPTPQAETAAPVAPAAPASAAPTRRRVTEAAAPAPPPTGPRIVVRDLEPVDGVEEIRVEKGDRVRFSVTSDRGDAVHIHGYDLEEPVAPGRAARFSFQADIEGIFEVELEDSAVPIAEVRVDP